MRPLRKWGWIRLDTSAADFDEQIRRLLAQGFDVQLLPGIGASAKISVRLRSPERSR